MLGLCHFIFATFSNEKVFTVTVTEKYQITPTENSFCFFAQRKYLHLEFALSSLQFIILSHALPREEIEYYLAGQTLAGQRH